MIVSNSLNILLIMHSSYPFSFNTYFIVAFSLVKLSLLVIMEYTLLYKEEINTFLTTCLVGGESCSLGIVQYA